MNMAVEFEEETKSIGEYIGLLKRRKKKIIIPAVVTFLAIVLVALLWPATYRSTATILIEEQEMPQEFVQSMITTFANQQIQVITQRALTLKNIMGLVNKYTLHDESDMKRLSKTEIAEKFQEDMDVNLVNAEVIDPRSGRPSEATIAFTLSYDHKSPGKAQKVTNDLVNLYLNENLKNRTEKAEGASAFLMAEADALSVELKEKEETLALFKTENEGALPEAYGFNINVIERTERELLDISVRISELEKNKLAIGADLAGMSPYAPTVLATGEQVLSDYDRLKALNSEYRRKSAKYSDQHPDVERLKREIEALQANGVSLTENDRQKQLQNERNILQDLNQKYESGHPKVIAQERVIAQLKADWNTHANTEGSSLTPDNPSYVLLNTQLKSNEEEINSLRKKGKILRKKIDKLEGFISASPAVEQKYQRMVRDYDNTRAKYVEIKAKQLEADVSKNLEQARKGQRFTLIDPPVLPEQPVSPNRFLIIVFGLVLSGAVGLGSALLAEALDPGLRGARALTSIVGVAPLAVVPYIYTVDEETTVDKRRIYTIAGLLIAVVIAFIGIHFFYKPLDVIWYILVRKYGF